MNNNFKSEPESPQDAQLRELLQSHLLVASPSNALQSRVAQLATQTPASKTSSLPRRQTLGWRLAAGTAAVAVLFMIGVALVPQVAPKPVMAGVELARVEAAMTRVSSAHLQRFRIENGKRVKEGELWFEDGKWCMQAEGYTGLYVQGTSWAYDAKSNTVTVDKNSKGLFHRNMTGFTLSNLVHDVANPGSKTTVTPQETTTVNGRLMKQALVETTDNYENTKISLVVDAQTDLPQSADMHVRTRYGKEGQWQFEFSYNEALAPQLFKPDFGSSAKFVDAKSEQKPTAQKENAKKKEVERKAPSKNDVAIQSLEVNPHGSVFLAYKVGQNSFAEQGCLTIVSDSLGTNYRGGGQLVKIYPSSPSQSVRGFWWVPAQPLSPGQKWQPRTFTVEFKLPPANLRAGQEFTTDTLQGVKFSVPVKQTTITIVPPSVQNLDSDWKEEKAVIDKETEMQNLG